MVNEEVSMSVEMALPIEFSDAAATKVKALITEEENPELKLRVYVTGGGCSGFQYGFTFDEKVNDGDMTIDKDDVTLVVDPMSLQYLVGGVVDYVEGSPGAPCGSVCNAFVEASALVVDKVEGFPRGALRKLVQCLRGSQRPRC